VIDLASLLFLVEAIADYKLNMPKQKPSILWLFVLDVLWHDKHIILGDSQDANVARERNKKMWSMWNAPSDLDYYGQSGFGGDEPEDEQEPELEPPDDLPAPRDELGLV
jgi:hypothetical protein